MVTVSHWSKTEEGCYMWFGKSEKTGETKKDFFKVSVYKRNDYLIIELTEGNPNKEDFDEASAYIQSYFGDKL